MYSPKENKDDTAEGDEADENDKDETKGRLSWLPRAFGLVSDVKVNRPKGLPPRRLTKMSTGAR